eukprot:4935259-Amphidinium_carterae.1
MKTPTEELSSAKGSMMVFEWCAFGFAPASSWPMDSTHTHAQRLHSERCQSEERRYAKCRCAVSNCPIRQQDQ